MGLIRAGVGAIGGTLADQWKEFFYCESIPKEILLIKGEKRIGKRSSNTKGSDNVITNGSGIVVADGQCMIIVDQGKVVDICAEPGEFTYDTSSEPSIFYGGLGKGILDSFKTMGRRFTFGGDTGKDQRVYYINTKELLDNKFGTPNPIPFRVVDNNIGLDIDVAVRCSGIYSYKIEDPIIFYTNVAGNVSNQYDREEIDSQLKAEFISALQPAFAEISKLGVRPSALPGYAEELSEAMNTVLSNKWGGLRGLRVISIGLNPITLPEEDAELIKQAQRAAILRDPTMAAATIAGAQADAMKGAASNEGGAMSGFIGMGMAQQAGGMSTKDLFAMGQQQKEAQGGGVSQGQAEPKKETNNNTWTCECGTENTGKFCQNCGKPKPESDEWTCSNCGTVNTGKFCQECGNPKPVEKASYKCSNCGWEPEDPTNPPKFCPECGDIFDDKDKI